MTDIQSGRWAANIDGDFVVFLIGAKAHKPWKVHKWLPVGRAMRRMIAELKQAPDMGLLHVERFGGGNGGVLVQYWRSFEHLHAYARNTDAEHLPAWAWFHKKVGMVGDVGIWHETYQVRAGQYEAIYGDMRPMGLGVAGTLIPATGAAKTARGRKGETQGEDYPEGILEEA